MARNPNLLQKQGFYNSLILYAGTGLAFFNLIVLFVTYLSPEEIGFYTILIALTTIFAQIASLGTTNVILRYYPYYRNDDKQDSGFVTFVVLVTLAGFVMVALFFLIFKRPVIDFYKAKELHSAVKASSLLVKYYDYIIPITFFIMLYTLLEALARSVFKNILSAFLKEVLVRIITAISVLLIAFKLADYHNFVIIFLYSNAAIALILWFSIFKGNYFKLNPITTEVTKRKREMISYGLYAVLSGGSFAMIQSVDTLVLSALTNDAMVGVYGVFFAIAVVINLPAKALNRTSYQIIANAFKDNDLEKIGKIYSKTSLVQSIVGCLFFIGLVANHHNIITILQRKNAIYEPYFDVFVIVGIAFLVDITGGLNSAIISSSKSYKLVMYLLTTGVLLCFGLNILLIPKLGMSGAAYSYLITMFALNFTYWLYIKVKFGLQPFTKSYLWVVLVSLISLFVGIYLPAINNFFVDVAYRSLIVALLYLALTYWLNISVDINELIDKALLRHKRTNIK
ncbi:polysaccharide biosynthesis C-terminal domain-containing protein [uncultured Mucilaginibacter sp.]|uniref:lipopolysaccharide biosynthesis protein n=1 Tax=uncultured Mucilaginibacter sp. TaxID=797541 RepID=UPI0025D42A93|nr:polysaccharide biosynthesis C-terminal domain-containing protein [uncultured Mucilaginibacter sp.]